MSSRCRTNFHEECEAVINKHIYLELWASHNYLSMVSTQYISLNLKIISLWIHFESNFYYFRLPISIGMLWLSMDLLNVSRKIRMRNVIMLKNSSSTKTKGVVECFLNKLIAQKFKNGKYYPLLVIFLSLRFYVKSKMN